MTRKISNNWSFNDGTFWNLDHFVQISIRDKGVEYSESGRYAIIGESTSGDFFTLGTYPLYEAADTILDTMMGIL